MSVTSSPHEASTEPPSESRLHEARAQGHVPRVELAGLAAAALVLTFALTGFTAAFSQPLHMLITAPLEALAEAREPTLELGAWAACEQIGRLLASCLLACCVGVVLARGLGQGFGFSLRALAPRRRFAPIASTRAVSGLLSCFGCGVAFLSVVPVALRVETADVTELLSGLSLRLVVVLALLSLVDTFLSRAAWLRSLWMTRRERALEAREAYGIPELRAARERVRRESRTEPRDRGTA